MAIISKGTTFLSGQSVTANDLNTLVDSANFVAGASGTTDNTTLEVHGSGYLQVKDDGITNGKIATGAVNADSIAADAVGNSELANNAVQTANIADSTGASDGVTTAKIASDAITTAKIAEGVEIKSANLAIFNNTGSSVEGGQLFINRATQTSGSFNEGNSFSVDAFIDNPNSYNHGVGAELFRFILTSGGVAVTHDINGKTGVPDIIFPQTNGAVDLGTTALRFDDIWSNGTFNGSDKNIKQDIEDLNEAEKRVAFRCKSLIKKYRLKDAVSKKGDDARIHVGIIAQELQAAFEAEGLDSFKYSMIGQDTWYEKKLEDKTLVSEEPQEGYTEITQLSVRYNELLAFIIAAL